MDPETERIRLKRVLSHALSELVTARESLEEETFPPTKKQRYRIFGDPKLFQWPCAAAEKNQPPVSNYTMAGGKSFHLTDRGMPNMCHVIAQQIGQAVMWRPRQILKALRIIQAATRWCDDRRAGREKQARDILTSQQWAVEALAAEVVTESMSSL